MTLQPVSVGLKYGFLIVLYLFLFWIATSSLFDLRMRDRVRGLGRGRGVVPADPTWNATSTDLLGSGDPLDGLSADFEPRLLVDHAAGHESGVAYDLLHGATLGRGDVEIQLDDPFASSRHAKITRQGRTLVLTDLGSTNGTYLNGEPLAGPQPLHPGDRIRIGDSEFTYLQ
ncbi:MAG TPA: FHA domain-containing protein [Solirubrobacteraceae bacterium]|nr:FHA domain-containing protein [Solirubrobacteraceae bacterium]